VPENHLQPRSEAWSGSERPLARGVARPLLRFLAQETAAGVVLAAATVAALVWANSPWSASYHAFWSHEFRIDLGGWDALEHGGHAMTFEGFVSDALMAVFFFVVGLEIATEFVVGELRDRAVAALPAVAAVGGMAVPALVFFALNSSGVGSSGWGIPMATDIAFAVGVLALLGSRVPHPLKLFLLTLAIVDDIGAILVIAVFYTDSLSLGWLLVAISGLVGIATMRRSRIWYTPVYILVGFVIWYATLQSGVHATIAGVAIGLLTPARPLLGERRFENLEDIVSGETAHPAELRDAAWRLRELTSVSTRLLYLISPWTSFLVVPIFALANAGVSLSSDQLSDAAGSSITWGVILGLVVGKPVGVVGATLIGRRLGWGRLSEGLNMSHIVGVGCIAGIGFTVAIFIANLSFDDAASADQAVLAVLAASILASVIGAIALSRATRTAPTDGRHIGGSAPASPDPAGGSRAG